jgi:hypothetical protein
MFLASPLSTHWSASLLGGGDWQEHRDVDGDGWADLAGYDRGVIRPRFFWDDKHGRTALLTGGVTFENRSGGTAAFLESNPRDQLGKLASDTVSGVVTPSWAVLGKIVVERPFERLASLCDALA